MFQKYWDKAYKIPQLCFSYLGAAIGKESNIKIFLQYVNRVFRIFNPSSWFELAEVSMMFKFEVLAGKQYSSQFFFRIVIFFSQQKK